MCQSMRACGKRPAAPRRAVAAVWTAIMMVAFVGMAGLVCDIGYVILVGTQLQNAADAAALAGAFKLWPNYDGTVVVAVAKNIAMENQAAKADVVLQDADITIGVFNEGTFTPNLDSPNAVRVVARRTSDVPAGPLPLLFGPIFGVSTANVQRTAIASIDPGFNGGLVIRNEHARNAFAANGNPTITIIDADMVVNSDHPSAVSTRGTAYDIRARSVHLMPDVVAPDTLGGARVRRMQEPLPDPLADLVEPDLVNMTPAPIYRHDSGVFVGSNKTVTISQPGIHVIGGKGIEVKAGGTFEAKGVMLYLVGSATIDIGGNGNFIVSHPTSGPYSDPGVVIWQARGNTEEATFGGGGQIEVDGIIYMRDARLNYGGNSETFSTQMVVDTLEMSGSASITIHWDGVRTPWASLVQ